MSATPPLLFTSSGPVQTPPATLLAAVLANVTDVAPGYTANLPGSMISDLSGTSVGALIVNDQARVDAVNNVSPVTANPYILNQFGEQTGLPIGQASNGSVYEVFSGPAGTVIAPGVLVGDGTNQYQTTDGGIIGSGGTSSPIFFVATNANVFPIPANSVTTLITPLTGVTCTNPLAGVAATGTGETVEDYRARLLQAGQVAISGTPSYLKTLLQAVPGVSPRLVSVQQKNPGWEIICGGGDPDAVAGAIFCGIASAGLLASSSTSQRNVNVSIFDPPDTYEIVFVNPPAQVTTVAVTWNTTLSGFVYSDAVNQYIIGAVGAYINAIPVGQPLNYLVMNEVIQEAVAPVLAAVNLTALTYVVTLNGTTVTPTSGTWIIPGDPESYFSISATGVTSAQG